MGLGGLLGNVMAGIGAGAGKGFAEDGKALREERMREIDREFQAGQNQANRDLTASEGLANRQQQTDLEASRQTFQGGLAEKQHGWSMDKAGFEAEKSNERLDKELGARSSEAAANRTFQAGQADKAFTRGLLTKAEDDATGRKYRFKEDGSVEYLDGVKGVDKLRQKADEKARERATAIIGKDNGGMQDPAKRDADWQSVYEREMRSLGYGPATQDGGAKAAPAGKDDPAKSEPVKGDTPPPDAPPKPHPDAVWSKEYGAYFVRGPSGWMEYKPEAQRAPEQYGPEVPPAIRKRMIDEAALQAAKRVGSRFDLIPRGGDGTMK